MARPLCFAPRAPRSRLRSSGGRNYLTDFRDMCLTRDALYFLIRKWGSLIEAHVDVKTADGYLVRMSVIGFTKQ
eukprot:5884048-Heterocapsa_arctica.AAC.1